MTDNESWQLEWDSYFDDLDHAIHRLLDLAARAESEDLVGLQSYLALAAADLTIHAQRCSEFVHLRVLELQTNLYKQNPLLKMLFEKASDASSASPFSAPVERHSKR